MSENAENTVNIEDEDVPLANLNDNEDGNTVEIEDEDVPLGVVDETETSVTNIEDEDTPLAAGVEKGAKRVWWWWILAILAALTGKTAYDKKNKKGIFKEKVAANAENTDNQKDINK